MKTSTVLKTLCATIAASYIIGVAARTNELSNKLEPLRTKFEKTVNAKNERDFEFNYGGKLEALADVKNQFAKDNHAVPRGWYSEITTLDKKNVAITPAPLALNPRYWFNDVDVSSLKPYLK